MKRELLTASALLLIVLGLPGAVFAYQAARVAVPGVRVVQIVGSAPAQGGWLPDSIRVYRGERIRLRIAASDVVHGLAVPGLDLEVEEILPGHVAEVEFTADKVGRFAFACTRWCGADHWRMRGVIEVVDPSNPGALAQAPAAHPPYSQLKLDLDAPRPPVTLPSSRPSAARGNALTPVLPKELSDRSWLRTHSPQDAFEVLRSSASTPGLSDDDLWDVVAAVWLDAAGPSTIARGAEQYARDCAACHGESRAAGTWK